MIRGQAGEEPYWLGTRYRRGCCTNPVGRLVGGSASILIERHPEGKALPHCEGPHQRVEGDQETILQHR